MDKVYKKAHWYAIKRTAALWVGALLLIFGFMHYPWLLLGATCVGGFGLITFMIYDGFKSESIRKQREPEWRK